MKAQIMILALTLVSSLNVFAGASSQPPQANSDLQEASREDSAEIMSAYYDTQKFALKTMRNGKMEIQEIHVVMANRYEPDAPINQNLFIIKTLDYPGVFNTGNIVIQKITQIAADTLELKGIGGQWFGGEGECYKKTVIVERTIQIKLQVENKNGYESVKPVFGSVVDVKTCK